MSLVHVNTRAEIDPGVTIIDNIINGRTVSVQSVWMQIAIWTGASVLIIVCFSLVRPRQSKIYAPKSKLQPKSINDPDYEPPPPPLSKSFFGWLSPVVKLSEHEMIVNIGLDAVTFLRLIRMMLYMLCVCSFFGIVLFGVNLAYNLKKQPMQQTKAKDKNYTIDYLAMFTLANVKEAWMWPALVITYMITFTVMFFIWRNWQAMIMLRQNWFRSPHYQNKINSRTLLITNVPREYRSDEGLIHLMQQLKVDGIKIVHDIDCTAIGRSLGDFPHLVEQHNEAVKELEQVLVKYLRHGKVGRKRPMVRKGGFMCCGGRKVDQIDYLAKQIKFLRDQVDERRSRINSLIKQERKARKGARASRIEGETYGFVTFKTVAEAHRINNAHNGKCRELGGAVVQLAPSPKDILWQNIGKPAAELHSSRMVGWFLLGGLFIAYAIPTLLISFLANLDAFSHQLGFIKDWENANMWSFQLVSGFLGPVVQMIFLFILPIIIRRICKYQGAATRSRLDRATTARYYFITIVWTLIFLSILGTVYQTVLDVISKVQNKLSFGEIMDELSQSLPDRILSGYISQSNYWLSWMPLRGWLVFYDLIQLIKLALVSFRRLLFHYTPRDIRELTKPYLFEYHTVSVNLLFVVAVALVYAPLAPLVVWGATIVMAFSYVVYKYQLLYVYVSRSESGGRMWNVYVNRVIAGAFFMQFLMILTTALIRKAALDAIAAVPPVIILIVFKVWMSRTAEPRFNYYRPTPDEAEEQRLVAMGEKPIRPSEMERKFLHPALNHNKLFTVMVHKKQEDLARQILSDYPWFAEKSEGTQIRGVREENLEYNPEAENATDTADWDARSIGSADLLSNFGDSGSNFGDNASVYSLPVSPMPPHATLSKSSLPFGGHHANHSTDELLASPAPLGYSKPLAGDPLLPGHAWSDGRSPSPFYPPYPGSGYHTPVYRTDSGGSENAMPYAYVESPPVPGQGYGVPVGGYFSPPPGATYPPEPTFRTASPSFPASSYEQQPPMDRQYQPPMDRQYGSQPPSRGSPSPPHAPYRPM